MPFLNRIVLFSAFAALLVSCSTKKNTVGSRAYHNLTARFNGYYYSCENIKDGVYKIEKSNKENYNKPLPVYVYPTLETAKTTFSEFDKAIKKSSLCIQKHAIKDAKGSEVPTAGKWIDNNWINIGVAHLYKREFFSGIEAFEYVAKTYSKSKDKYEAMIWLIRANNEIGGVSASEQTLSFLKNQRHLPRKITNELPVVYADYYMRRGQNSEAMARLMEACRNKQWFVGLSKKRRARYSFIVAQLAEQNNDNERAIEYYQKTIKMKAAYEMVFYSKIKIVNLTDITPANAPKIKKGLLKMTKETKNSDYFDVIYYTLGGIEERQRNMDKAVFYYKRSVQTSTSNQNQKALAFLKLSEINFDLTNYQLAGAYYDSTIAVLSKDHPNYESVLARKKTLEALVNNINIVSREDSLQRIAKMSESERNAYIDRMIEKLKEDEERKRLAEEMAKNSNANSNGGGMGQNNMGGGADLGEKKSFYFYNPNTVAIGVADFKKNWGDRKLEDNWRRSNKGISIDAGGGGNDTNDNSDTKQTASSSVQDREYYLKGLPLHDTLMQKSNAKIIKAYYTMGSIYKEELNNSKKAVNTFETLNTRFPDNQYLLNTYYTMYRIYLAENNQPKAEYYKNKIFNEFPESEFAALIKNPSYAADLNAKKSEVEKFYAGVYEYYHDANYALAHAQAQEGITKFGKSDYLPKFEFIKSMCTGKMQGADTLEKNLKLLVVKYPNADIVPTANDVLAAINRQRNAVPDTSTAKTNTVPADFEADLNAEHFIVAVVIDDPRISDGFKINLAAFNSKYYDNKKFNMKSNVFGKGKQMIVLKTFANAYEVMSYYENLMIDADVFKGDVQKEYIDVLPISAGNLPSFYSKKNVEAYKTFFEENYTNLGKGNAPKK
ncbi:MAG: hypothetical protein KF900_11430 [Bacteroidetes bacterium]|nr:hypothetical protein [Bacteroidota bacterium]